jgi:hypothetical protein
MVKNASIFFVIDKIQTVKKFVDTINVNWEESNGGACAGLQRRSCIEQMRQDGFQVCEVEQEDRRRVQGLASSRQGSKASLTGRTSF